MTVLWTSLIVVGVVLIVVALWPSVRGGRGGKAPEQNDGKEPEGF